MERFLAAWAGYRPDPTDNPDCVGFYRVALALAAEWGRDFWDAHNTSCHYAGCNASYCREPADAYRVALETLRDFAARMETPKRPERHCWYSCRPSDATEADAFAEFKRQFKAAFPGKRINSAFAKEKWVGAQAKAMEIVTGWALSAQADHDREEARREAAYMERLAGWQAAMDKQAAFRAAVERIGVAAA